MIRQTYPVLVLIAFLLLVLTACSYVEKYWAAFSVRISPRMDLIDCRVSLDGDFLTGPMFVMKGCPKSYSDISRCRPSTIEVSWQDKDGSNHEVCAQVAGKYPDEWKVKGDVIVVIINNDNSYDLEFVVFEGEWNKLKIKRLPPKGQQ